MARKALICGISGQDGAYLAKLLVDKGYIVHGTSRDCEANSFSNLLRLGIRGRIAVHSMQLTDFRSVLAVLSRVEPDEIYNLSGQSSVGLSFDQPLETFESVTVGTLNLLECIRFLGGRPRFYNAASSEMFGDTKGKPADESTAFRPCSPYAMAKAASFWAVNTYRDAYGIFACSGILFNHESPLRPKRYVTRKIISAAARIAAGHAESLMLGNLKVVRDWGWAPDYVDAMWRMLQQDHPGDYVVATGQSCSLEEFTRAAFAAFQLNWLDHVRIDESLFRAAEIASSVGDPAKARAQLGWEAQRGMQGVVEKMAEAERSADPHFSCNQQSAR
jgi:GDPmannose 4,6-dehydratase